MEPVLPLPCEASRVWYSGNWGNREKTLWTVTVILEGLVTTLDDDGSVHVAPMGPIVDRTMGHLRLRPFQTSQTYQNLKRRPSGVFHVVDDVLLLARAAVGKLDSPPETMPARRIPGTVLTAACRWYEFQIESIDDRHQRAEMTARVIHCGRLRDGFGFNRAAHAVLEAAILATRLHLLPPEQVQKELAALRVLVDKTAGPREAEAFALLERHVAEYNRSGESPAEPRNITVTTGARLHFGPLSWQPTDGPNFGGAGLMIDAPGFLLDVRAAAQDEIVGDESWINPVAELRDRIRSEPAAAAPPCRIEIRSAIPAHSGLGSGTQLGMAVARSLTLLQGERDLSPKALAERVGRGCRSAIGIHGFDRGGFLIDAGKLPGETIGSLAARIECPGEWRILLATPAGETGLCGSAECNVFDRLSPMPQQTTDTLCRLTLRELLPALAEHDFDRFSRSLFAFGRTVGEFFAPVQGGLFAGPSANQLVNELRRRGFHGVGQSSWGPTLFVFCPDETSANDLLSELSTDPRWQRYQLHITGPLNTGAGVIDSRR